jgi:hypothetical protein
MFGGADWIHSHVSDASLTSSLAALMHQHQARPSCATAVVSISGLQAAEEEDAASLARSSVSSGSGQRVSDSSSWTSSSGSSSRTSSSSGGSEVPLPSADAAAVLVGFQASEPWGSSSSTSKDAAGSVPKQQPALAEFGVPCQPSQLALLCFEDVVQAGVPSAVAALQSGSWAAGGWWGRSRGLASAKDVVMLTGDNAQVAAAVAQAVGITNYKAGLKPEDKLAYVRQAAAEAASGSSNGSGNGAQQSAASAGSAVSAISSARSAPSGLLMAGDGINDAPALAAAQVSMMVPQRRG